MKNGTDQLLEKSLPAKEKMGALRLVYGKGS